MKTRPFTVIAVAASLAAALSASAQTTRPATSPPQPKRPGVFQRLFGHHPAPARPGVGTRTITPISGGIVGNKNTHVYHLPGDKNLPDPKNRVYFRTEAQARAAGYHAAGRGGPAAHSPAPHRGMRMPTAAGAH